MEAKFGTRAETPFALKWEVTLDSSTSSLISVNDAVEPFSGSRILWIRGLSQRVPADLFPAFLKRIQAWKPSFSGYLGFDVPSGANWETALQNRGFQDYRLYLECETKSGRYASEVGPAKPEDIEAIQALSRSSIGDLLCLPPACSLTQALERCEKVWPTYSQSCDLEDSDLLFLVQRVPAFQGYAVLDFAHDTPWLNDLCIKTEKRGGETARNLLQTAKAECKKRGFRFLVAQVAKRNPRSWKPALRCGFQLTSREWVKRERW